MSFDLKLVNGDITIGENGDFAVVRDSEKLVQDLLKMLLTPLGSNVFYSWYGSPLSRSIIGTALDVQFITSIAQNQIRSAVETLQALQKEQMGTQKVSATELIAAIREVSLLQNQIDPTFFTVSAAVVTKALTIVPVVFDVTL